MINKNIRWITVFMLSIVIISSCNYDEKNLIDGKGSGIVRIEVPGQQYGINFAVTAFDAVKQTRPILTINRDAVSNADLNTAVTVTFSLDSSFLRVLNDSLKVAQSDTFHVLPAKAYTWATDGLSGNTLTFAAGEAVKEISVQVDPASLSFTTLYALPIRLSNASGNNTVSNASGTVVSQIIVKNKYDARYTVTGSLTDLQVTTIDGSCTYPWDVSLITNGASQVILYDNLAGGIYHSICSSGGASIYGNVGVVFNFDSNDNVISVVDYYNDPLPRGRTLQLDPSGVNKFDPVTKTLKVKYWLNQANGTQPHRTYFDETYTYKGPR